MSASTLPSLFAVGVTGHRLNRLPERSRPAVEAEVGRLLDRILASGRTATRPIQVRLVSGLAEGADRMAADAALARGIALHAILPFAISDYEQDFSDAQSRVSFRALLAKAAHIEALPGTRADADGAYEAAGLAMLDACDLLIAVWDGGPSGGRGGTTEMVAAASARGLPVLWVDPSATRATKPYGDAATSCDESIAAALARVLSRPI